MSKYYYIPCTQYILGTLGVKMCFLLFMLIADNRLVNGNFFSRFITDIVLEILLLIINYPPIVPNCLDFEVLVILKVRMSFTRTFTIKQSTNKSFSLYNNYH